MSTGSPPDQRIMIDEDIPEWCRLVDHELRLQARLHQPMIEVQATALTTDLVLIVDYLDPWLPDRQLRLRRALWTYQREDGPWWPDGLVQPAAPPPAEEVARAIVEGDLGEPLGAATATMRLEPDGAVTWGDL